MRIRLSLMTMLVIIGGCMGLSGNPSSPAINASDPAGTQSINNRATNNIGPYKLWGDWTFYFNSEHDKVDVVPRREARFHLNALKFLEDYCTDCVQITNIINNGDDTIDLAVRISHPFPEHPEYTGFDVKGIIMFSGSYMIYSESLEHFHVGDPCVMSWRETGDPELLNADGYTYRWSPKYDSGSILPIFNYWEGKYANGLPDATINGFINYYSEENRHVFYADDNLSRTYRIYLPPGQPVTAGYAVEACWEPPILTPVTDPITDFPITANQTEPYYFEVILNNSMPIERYHDCCGYLPSACDSLRFVVKEWDVNKIEALHYESPGSTPASFGLPIFLCNDENEPSPFYPDSYSIWEIPVAGKEQGLYRDLAIIYYYGEEGKQDIAVDLVDYAVFE